MGVDIAHDWFTYGGDSILIAVAFKKVVTRQQVMNDHVHVRAYIILHSKQGTGAIDQEDCTLCQITVRAV